MKPRNRIAIAVLVAPVLVAAARAESAARGATPSPGSYASVNGLRMYYEVHGTGRPLVLLHGAFGTIPSNFGKVIPTLARTRQVIAIEQQAHGRTADIDRPLPYEQMADDTAELLRQLGIAQADFFGIPPEALRAIAAPALFIVGDADVITIEHTVAMSRLLPHAQLAVFPGTNHDPEMMSRTEWLLAMIPPFLDAPMPEPNTQD